MTRLTRLTRLSSRPWDDLVVAQASSSNDGDDDEATDSSSSDTESDSEEDTHVTCELTGNHIIDISCLDELLSEVAVCSNCRKGQLTLQESECVGLVPMWILECDTCNVRTEMAMGEKPDQAKFFDINRRSTLAMRLVGRGRDALDKICAVLDLPAPVAKLAFDRHNSALHLAAEEAAHESMTHWAKELRDRRLADGVDRPRDVDAPRSLIPLWYADSDLI